MSDESDLDLVWAIVSIECVSSVEANESPMSFAIRISISYFALIIY